MNFKIFGKQVKVGEVFSKHSEEILLKSVQKYFPNPVSSIISVSKKNKNFNINIVLHINKKMEFTAQSNGMTAKLAFDDAIDKLSKQLRRYKRKIKNHKNNELMNKPNPLNAQFHIINEPPKLNNNNNKAIKNEPIIFAELDTEIEELTVAEALEKMKLGNIPALMFRNKKHSGLNMIYRREDDLIGWIDPRGNRNSAKI
jgi:ribosomal subunit interface protein|tara:strand:+ start:1080 stop:1679 length:600 start_codon:yes stop_codon:yes gene_type:complete